MQQDFVSENYAMALGPIFFSASSPLTGEVAGTDPEEKIEVLIRMEIDVASCQNLPFSWK